LTAAFPFAVSPRSISVLLDNRWRSIDASSPNYPPLYQALKAPEKDIDLIRSLIDIPAWIAKATFGRIQVGEDSVLFDGKRIGGVYVDRILTHLKEGFDIEPLARYLEKREQNPVFTAREELDLFFANAETAIAPDGDVFVFKKVQDDYTSYHKGRDGKVFTHTIGSVVEIDENEVDLDRNNTCSSGLHFCSYPYLSSYYGGQGRVMILKLNPAHVRAIPSDYNNAKGRAVRYLVVGEVPEEDAKQFFAGSPVSDYGFQYWDGGFTTEEDGFNGDSDEFESEPVLDYGDEWQCDDTIFDNGDIAEIAGPLPSSLNVEYIREFFNSKTYKASANELGSAFLWSGTKQGQDFWQTAYQTLKSEAKAEDRVYEILAYWLELVEKTQDVVIEADAEDDAEDDTEVALSFRTKDGRLFTAQEITELVKEHGQRGFSRISGIPRTTIQEWLARID
jgi:hypothetical protein